MRVHGHAEVKSALRILLRLYQCGMVPAAFAQLFIRNLQGTIPSKAATLPI